MSWDRGAGDDESTVYIVRRAEGRGPADPADGDDVYQGPGTGCTDSQRAGRPAGVLRGVRGSSWASRRRGPRRAGVTLAAAGDRAFGPCRPCRYRTAVVCASGRGGAESPAALRGIHRSTVPVRGSSCRVTGLPAGRQQRFEVTAVYRGPQGERAVLGTRDRSQLYQQHPRRGRFRSGSLKPDRPHLDFDVLFSRSGEDYRALITRSPAGRRPVERFSAACSLKISWQNLVLKVGMFRAPRTRRIASPAVQAAKNAGGKLFDAVVHRASGRMPAPEPGSRRGPAGADAENPVPACRLPRSSPTCRGNSSYEQSQDWFLALLRPYSP